MSRALPDRPSFGSRFSFIFLRCCSSSIDSGLSGHDNPINLYIQSGVVLPQVAFGVGLLVLSLIALALAQPSAFVSFFYCLGASLLNLCLTGGSGLGGLFCIRPPCFVPHGCGGTGHVCIPPGAPSGNICFSFWILTFCFPSWATAAIAGGGSFLSSLSQVIVIPKVFALIRRRGNSSWDGLPTVMVLSYFIYASSNPWWYECVPS